MPDTSHHLPPDAQAIFLLCAHMGSKKDQVAEPLSTGEYNRLADWLNKSGMSPGDLLSSEGADALAEFTPHNELTPERVQQLLDRGAALAFEVEAWTNAGGWILARSDARYPTKLKERLKHRAPPLLYGVGPHELLADGALSIVGSRDASPAALAFVQDIAAHCAREGLTVVSGGARGVDKQAMDAALDAGGTVVGSLANGLAQTARTKRYREAIVDERLTLISAFHPKSRFIVWKAMDRNKHIYALGEGTLVAHAAKGSGGTWAGATENLRHAWVPLFVLAEAPVPDGNRALLEKGGIPVDRRLLSDTVALRQWLEDPAILADVEPAADALMADGAEAGDGQAVADRDTPGPLFGQQLTLEETAARYAVGNTKDEALALFPLVWPVLREFLHEPRSARAVCGHFSDVRLAQIRDWLTAAVEQGLAIRQERPVRYVLRENELHATDDPNSPVEATESTDLFSQSG